MKTTSTNPSVVTGAVAELVLSAQSECISSVKTGLDNKAP